MNFYAVIAFCFTLFSSHPNKRACAFTFFWFFCSPLLSRNFSYKDLKNLPCSLPVYGPSVISLLMLEYLTSFQCFIYYKKYFSKHFKFLKMPFKPAKTLKNQRKKSFIFSAYAADYFFWAIGILGMDFESIFKTHYSWWVSLPHHCVYYAGQNFHLTGFRRIRLILICIF